MAECKVLEHEVLKHKILESKVLKRARLPMTLTQIAAGTAILTVLAAQVAAAQPAPPPPPDQPAPAQSLPPPPPDQPPPPPRPGKPPQINQDRRPAHRRKRADRRPPAPSIPMSICGRDRVQISRLCSPFLPARPSASAAAAASGAKSRFKVRTATSSRQVWVPRRRGPIRRVTRRRPTAPVISAALLWTVPLRLLRPRPVLAAPRLLRRLASALVKTRRRSPILRAEMHRRA